MRPFTVEDEDIIHVQGHDAAGPAIAVEKFDFQAVGRQQLDDRPHIARGNIGIVIAVCDRDQIEQFGGRCLVMWVSPAVRGYRK